MIFPQWKNSQRIIVAHNKQIYWFDLDGSSGSFPVLSNNRLTKAVPYQAQQLIVEMGRVDWDVSLFNWAEKGNKHQTISRSIYLESMGQFRPAHKDFSLLSLRSGQAQIWLSSQGKTQQLTKSQKPIQSYVWSKNGKKIAFLAGGQLYVQIVSSGRVKPVITEATVIELFQWFIDDAGEDKLLIAMRHENSEQIVSLNLANFTTSIEYSGSSLWAQKINQQVLIINGQYGKLLKLNEGKLQAITALSDVKLQWRYYFRGEHLYFQDKQLNIWRLNPLTVQAEIVGHFDKNALMMTDILPQQQQMLSERFISQSSELMLIH